MPIERLIWDGGNAPHRASHGISRAAVEDLVFWGSWVRVRSTRYPGQIRLIGVTPGGRWLTIAVEPTATPGGRRPVTGWPCTEREVAYYVARRRAR